MLASLDSATRLLGLIGALVALLAALAVLGLARGITVPLTELTTSAGHFANGEFDWPVPHDARGDEVGDNARSSARAIRSGSTRPDRPLATEQQKLQSELDIARNIQRSMLPRDRDFADGSRRYRLQARLEPAKAVGGYFHGHFLHGDGQLWFAVGDVSDKGVPAALFMVRALTVLEVATAAGDARTRCWPTPAATCPRSNRPACSPPCCAACWTWPAANWPSPARATTRPLLHARMAASNPSRSSPARARLRLDAVTKSGAAACNRATCCSPGPMA
jgi:HAMP domain-containing protein